jgi:hypothetical protein
VLISDTTFIFPFCGCLIWYVGAASTEQRSVSQALIGIKGVGVPDLASNVSAFENPGFETATNEHSNQKNIHLCFRIFITQISVIIYRSYYDILQSVSTLRKRSRLGSQRFSFKSPRFELIGAELALVTEKQHQSNAYDSVDSAFISCTDRRMTIAIGGLSRTADDFLSSKSEQKFENFDSGYEEGDGLLSSAGVCPPHA